MLKSCIREFKTVEAAAEYVWEQIKFQFERRMELYICLERRGEKSDVIEVNTTWSSNNVRNKTHDA